MENSTLEGPEIAVIVPVLSTWKSEIKVVSAMSIHVKEINAELK